MEDTSRKRRGRILLTISGTFLLLSIVMVFFSSGVARWLNLATWSLLTFIFWNLRKSPRPGP
jgi:hypothetical protein